MVLRKTKYCDDDEEAREEDASRLGEGVVDPDFGGEDMKVTRTTCKIQN